MKKTTLVLSAVLVSLVSSLSAQDLQKGLEAYRSGDYAVALGELVPLAEQGNEIAQYNLGLMYFNGNGVPSSFEEMLKWHSSAAALGSVDAQLSLGNIYRGGFGVAQDFAEAATFYKQAAEQGNAKAQNNLAALFAKGLGVPKDAEAAVRWYRTAAEQGDSSGQVNLGIAYDKGKGVSEDDVLAYMWLHIAHNNGGGIAASMSKGLVANNLTEKEISMALELADECLARDYANCGY
ncbi:tetratricopeptide repeat protein [Roseovarius aestuarii]|uniref:Putative beta-lactamase HcpC n=1 Tax=Roseovarius aestuarii TaxID=475083 RepID=A0A1X7BTM0_9RHOB|nr:tetratricopeptide repeat protein [Roseovarius aestuarii]SMC12850.1 Putative beta-lactamase HcpC precursor [Roseovarius aestuarii]